MYLLISGRKEIQVEGRNIRWNFKACLMSSEEALGHYPATGYHRCSSKHRFSVHQKELEVFIDTEGGKSLETSHPRDQMSKRQEVLSLCSIETAQSKTLS